MGCVVRGGASWQVLSSLVCFSSITFRTRCLVLELVAYVPVPITTAWLFFFFFFLRAYGSSQARDRIRAAAAATAIVTHTAACGNTNPLTYWGKARD